MMRHSFFCLLFMTVVFGFICDANAEPAKVTAPPAEMHLDPFYTKYLDCEGIAVIGSDRVDDRAFYRLRELLDQMLKTRPDLRQTLVDENFRYIIIAQEEQVTDVPEYADMKPKEFWNRRARGFGGRTTSCGEENLLCLPEDRYADESIFIHELAHGIHRPGLVRCEPGFQKRLDALYQKAMDKGLYKNDYASTNASEYWAESVQAFFDCDRENNWNHNHVNTREELTEYDPEMAAFVAEIFRITEENDWRFVPLAQQPIVEITPASMNEDGLLPKYIWCRGFSIYGTQNVSEQDMLCVETIVRNLFRYRHDILQEMIDRNVSVAVSSPEDSERPEGIVNGLSVNAFTEQQDGRTVSKLPDQLSLAALADAPGRFIHELALAAYLYTGLRELDPAYDSRRQEQQYEKGLERMDVRFDQQVQVLYESAMNKGLWKSTPAAQNRFEYFAEGVCVFFDGSGASDSAKRPVNREQLAEYDPDLAVLIEDVFKHPQRTDWRYESCK